MLAQDFVHQLYTDSSAIVEFGCSWKMAQCPPLKDYLLGIFRKSKGHLATLLQLYSISMLLSMHNFRSASEDTDSTATSQASMMTWVPFDFIACKVWENLLRLQSSWHLLVLTSHFRVKKRKTNQLFMFRPHGHLWWTQPLKSISPVLLPPKVKLICLHALLGTFLCKDFSLTGG